MKPPLIISYGLWRIFFKTVPRHPLYWFYTLRHPLFQRPTRERSKQERRRQFVYDVLLVLAGIAVLVTALLPLLITVSVLGTIVPLIVLFGGYFAGLQIALSIGASLEQEMRSRRGDLVAMAGDGLVGVGWATAAHRIRADKTSLNLRRLIGICYTFAMVMTLIVTGGIIVIYVLGGSVIDFDLTEFVPGLITPINALVIISLMSLDLLQSQVAGVLVGIITPTFESGRSSNLTQTFIVFSIAQLAFYALVGVVILITGVFSFVDGFLLTALRVVLILAAREVVNRALWYYCARRLNTDWREMHILATVRRI